MMAAVLPLYTAHPETPEVAAESAKVVIPDCGHIPVCESPDIYRKVVEDFLKSD